MGELIFRSRSKSLAHISINGLMRIESCWLTARAAVARRGTRAATVASHCDYCLVDRFEVQKKVLSLFWRLVCEMRMKKKKRIWSDHAGSYILSMWDAAFVRWSQKTPPCWMRGPDVGLHSGWRSELALWGWCEWFWRFLDLAQLFSLRVMIHDGSRFDDRVSRYWQSRMFSTFLLSITLRVY